MAVTISGTSGVTLPNGGVFPAGYFQSSPQTIAASGSTALVSHGLGAQPKLMYVTLQCISADLGYSVGDEVPMPFASEYSVGGFTCFANATQCGSIVNANLQIANKSTSTFSTITYASWKIIFRAWI